MTSSEPPTLLYCFEDSLDWIQTVCFSRDQNTVCSAGDDRLLTIWDLALKEKISEFNGHTGYIRSLDHSGRMIASASYDDTIGLWNPFSKNGNLIVLKGHTDGVNCVKFNSRGNRLLSGARDSSIRVWDIERKTETLVIEKTHYGAFLDFVYSVYYLDSDETFVSGGADDLVKIWDTREKTNDSVHTFSGHMRSVSSVCFHSESQILASSSYDGTVKIYDMRSLKPIHVFDNQEQGWIKYVDFHPSGKYIISCSDDKCLKIFDIQKKKEIYKVLDTDIVSCVRFSPDGNYIISGNNQHEVKLWKSNITFSQHDKTDLLERLDYVLSRTDEFFEEGTEEKIEIVWSGSRFSVLKSLIFL